MTINLFREFGARCWYCGATEPVHEKFPDCEINACRSCIRLRSKNGLEEFRTQLAERKIAGKTGVKELTGPRIFRTKERHRRVDALIPWIDVNIPEHKFYFEELAIDFLCEMDSVDTKTWHHTDALSGPDLLRELGAKCWYCGRLLCRYKQEWRDVKIPLGNGNYVEGREVHKVTPYYGRPTHDNVGDFTVNACRSCTSRRHRKPLDEFRRWLGVRVIPEAQELQSLEAALGVGIVRTDEERRAMEQTIRQLRVIGEGYKFYMEELILHCVRGWNARNPFRS